MKKRRTRDLFLHLLQRELGHALPVLRHDEDLYDMWEIVNVCLAYPGAIHALITELERFHQGSRSVQAIRDLVEDLLPEPLLQPAERRELYQLAATLERGGTDLGLGASPFFYRELYRETVGPAGPLLEKMAHTLVDILAELEDLPFQDVGIPPLLKFVELLAGQAYDSLAVELQSWRDRFAERLGLPPAVGSVPLLPQRATRHMAKQAYLVIEFRPDTADPSRYLASAWLQYTHELGISLLREDRPQPLDELPRIFEKLLVGDQQVVDRRIPELTVEFVLPRQLIGAPLDQYPYSSRGLKRRLGLDYPVVVRSLERMRNQQLKRTWQRKWNWFVENPGGGTVIWVAASGEYEAEQLYALLCESSRVCLALAFPLENGLEFVDELEIGLQAGTPIVLWCREGTDPDQFVAEVGELLSSDLMTLPQKIQDLRIKAAQAPDVRHPGNHLTLIFEDADRIPEPYVRLRPPT